ncbi:MAG: Ribokinase [Ktedonobacterales bacterium]|nr:MAG: Ribokinase [Ktedonobacterales bacterium]
MAITVVGSVALDTIETPFGGADNVLGGAASHFTMAASLYDTVNLVAVIGTDFPQPYLDYFEARRVDRRGLQTVEGQTFRWGGRYHLDMNTRDTLFTELGVFAGFAPTLPDDYQQAHVTFLANIQPQLQHGVLRQARAGGASLCALDTMNLWIETAHDDLIDVMRGVDVMLIAEEEARQIANTASLRAAARFILDLGPQMVIVKQGSYGALLYGSDGTFFAAPAYPLAEVRDPTGAGDAFAGGFLGYLARQRATTGTLTPLDYKRGLIHGNILGSFACEDFSVERLRTLTPDDIAARYREFVGFTHFEGTS